VQKKLQEASNTIDKTAVRSRSIERKLRNVQELPASDAQTVLMLEQDDGNGEAEEEVEEVG
jgi:DNA recombination protein RmuC